MYRPADFTPPSKKKKRERKEERGDPTISLPMPVVIKVGGGAVYSSLKDVTVKTINQYCVNLDL